MAESCDQCQGTGFRLEQGEGGVVSSRRCPCDGDRRSERLLDAARIPRRYDCSFTGDDSTREFEIHHPSHEAALRLARSWVDLFPAVEHGLMFLGTPGLGKTHLAVAIARELILTKGVRVLFYEQRALLKRLQGTFEDGSSQRESQILGPVLQAELLILDDLGAGRTTPWARDVLHDVIAQRYNENRLMIITSNLAPGEYGRKPSRRQKQLDQPLTLTDRLGDALMSRLHEMCRLVALGGEDYRSGVLAQKNSF